MTIRTVLLLLLICTSVHTHAKSSSEDSLQRIIHSKTSSSNDIASAYFELFKIDCDTTLYDYGKQVCYNLKRFREAKSFFNQAPPSTFKLRYQILNYNFEVNNLSKVEQVNRCNDNLTLAKRLNETSAIVDILFQKEKIFCENDLPKKGISYLKQALYYQKKLPYDPHRLSLCYFMIGWRIYNSGIYKQSESVYWLKKAYEIIKDVDDEDELYSKCEYSGWVSNAYTSSGEFDKALKYRNIALEYAKEFPPGSVGRKTMIFDCYRYLGQIYLIKKDYPQAISTLEIALDSSYVTHPDYTIWVAATLSKAYASNNDLANAKRVIDLIVKDKTYNSTNFYKMFALKYAANLYQKMGNYQEASSLYKTYVTYNDSVQLSNKQTDIGGQDLKYALETEELKLRFEQDKKDAVYQKDRQKQLVIRNSLIAGAFLFILLIVVLFRSNKQKNKDNLILMKQRNELDIQKREILSSISYAKRIQNAILPPSRVLNEYLHDYFVLYKPKDIVAGDFYWLEHYNNVTFLAAADCTGHGVPGAMVSVICHNGLNRSLREYGYSDPGSILNQTRELVIKEFEKSDEEVKDGMDISLCAFNENTLRWAGANNPLWIIRNDEIIELKPDKQPIGQYVEKKEFNTHTIQLQDNDLLYLFTDGFKDQFGGVNEKKFKAMQFRELLLKIKDLPMEIQKATLNETFEKWKGDNEQVDDVCVIGVRYRSAQFT